MMDLRTHPDEKSQRTIGPGGRPSLQYHSSQEKRLSRDATTPRSEDGTEVMPTACQGSDTRLSLVIQRASDGGQQLQPSGSFSPGANEVLGCCTIKAETREDHLAASTSTDELIAELCFLIIIPRPPVREVEGYLRQARAVGDQTDRELPGHERTDSGLFTPFTSDLLSVSDRT
jgi:hypothetical protein